MIPLVCARKRQQARQLVVYLSILSLFGLRDLLNPTKEHDDGL